IRSATDFLPSYIRQFINLVSTLSPNLSSGKTSRLTAALRRDMAISLFWTLGAVFRTALTAVFDALGVERTADDMIAHTREILDPPTADQDNRVLLQVVTLARDVTRHLKAVGEPHARHFAQSGIGLFRRGRVDARAHPALLRAGFHRRHLVACHLRPPRIADQLVYRRHPSQPSKTKQSPDAIVTPGRWILVPNLYAPPHKSAEPYASIRLRLGGVLRPAPNRTILLCRW